MKILLDTHLLIWAKTLPARLPQAAREAIVDELAAPYFSTVSIWEASIKFGLGRDDSSLVEPRRLRSVLLESGFEELDLSARHALAVSDLPLHHGDPFDRMLITQAKLEAMLFLTADKELAEYGDPVRLVG
ncbi:type II toxin-antitoxin system VapC family toxin [Gryllotalpicola protaetiae]|uniref:Type II toxin-antitoxin system VapC family toxin n=1 Tax=Gryllotalpicola protaetiae TaxID=2419771 RepID=A0A387BIH2_9MICO|nr:type II toxin-antitoxin system VapC family toxin [Gryllotalpicola protaetiae]AYG03603.1 type II toxin-antitoxin system VapC family toxin [Gryllotalpicola protaetiae]